MNRDSRGLVGTMVKDFLRLLWTIAVIAFVIGVALGVYLAVELGFSADTADAAVRTTALLTGG